MHILPKLVKDLLVFHPAILSMPYNPYPRHAEKPVASCKCEYAQGLGQFDPTTNALSTPLSIEEPPYTVNNVGIYVQHGHIGKTPVC
jgi:hypothetical protein